MRRKEMGTWGNIGSDVLRGAGVGGVMIAIAAVLMPVNRFDVFFRYTVPFTLTVSSLSALAVGHGARKDGFNQAVSVYESLGGNDAQTQFQQAVPQAAPPIPQPTPFVQRIPQSNNTGGTLHGYGTPPTTVVSSNGRGKPVGVDAQDEIYG